MTKRAFPVKPEIGTYWRDTSDHTFWVYRDERWSLVRPSVHHRRRPKQRREQPEPSRTVPGTAKERTMLAWCMKCKAKRDVNDPQTTTMKNGRPATRGTCASCGTKVYKIGDK